MSFVRYKWCLVPNCKSTSVKTPKKMFIKLPDDINLRTSWLQLAGRDPKLLSRKSLVYFCEDHFDLEKDMENYIRYKIMGSVKKIIMKRNCLPCRFDCQEVTGSRIAPSSKPLLVLRQDIEEICIAKKIHPSLQDHIDYVKSASFCNQAEQAESDDLLQGAVKMEADIDLLPHIETRDNIDEKPIYPELQALANDIKDPLPLDCLKKEPSPDETQSDDNSLFGIGSIESARSTDGFSNIELRDMVSVYAQENFSQLAAHQKIFETLSRPNATNK